jgi:hypothetical protein
MRQKLVIAAMMLSSCAAPPAPIAQRPLTELAGRTAGAPKDCLPVKSTEGVHFASDRTTLVYGSGKTIWVNALGPNCPFGLNDIPIFEPTASSYCRGDIVRSVDRDSHIAGPSCVLGEFIPYTRP